MFKKKKESEPILMVKPVTTFEIDPMEEAYAIVVTKKFDDIILGDYPVAVSMWLDRMITEFKAHDFSTLNRCILMFGLIEVTEDTYRKIMRSDEDS